MAFDETSPTSGDFVHSELIASCGEFPKNSPGTFMPIICRLPSGSSVDYETLQVEAMGTVWDLHAMDFGDGEWIYVVDKQNMPTVFNPTNGETHPYSGHIQTKPIEDAWYQTFFHPLNITDKGGFAQLKQAEGLLVGGGFSSAVFDHCLKSSTVKTETFTIGTRPFVNLRKHPGKNVELLNEINYEIRSEILWKYVTAKGKVIAFGSYNGLINDITYREKAVAAAKKARFAYIGQGDPANGIEVKLPKDRKELWAKDGGVPSDTGFLTVTKDELTDGTSAFDAIKDIFNFTTALTRLEYDDSIYAMACEGGANAICLYAAAQVLGKAKFDEIVGQTPFAKRDWVLDKSVVKNNCFWIPGDRGSLKNNATGIIPHTNYDAENVIYLGGSMEVLDFNVFSASAKFWGLGMGVPPENNDVMTLQAMINGLEHSGGNKWANMSVEPWRVSFREIPRSP